MSAAYNRYIGIDNSGSEVFMDSVQFVRASRFGAFALMVYFSG